MTSTPTPDSLADALERAAEALDEFASHANAAAGDVLDAVRQKALNAALNLTPDATSVTQSGWRDTRRLRHSAAASLLRLASLSRANEATSAADGAVASALASELMAAANELRSEAAGLE